MTFAGCTALGLDRKITPCGPADFLRAGGTGFAFEGGAPRMATRQASPALQSSRATVRVTAYRPSQGIGVRRVVPRGRAVAELQKAPGRSMLLPS